MEIRKVQNKHLNELRKLYVEAFPKSERKPFALMRIWEKAGKMEILEIADGEKFCGLLITVLFGKLVLVDYLAISPKMQGMGIGSVTIENIRKRYRGKRVFLEIETTLKPCSDMQNRMRRKNFYLKNGLTPCGFSVYLFGVEMEVLAFDAPVTYEEYLSLYSHLAGNLITRKIEKSKNCE